MKALIKILLLLVVAVTALVAAGNYDIGPLVITREGTQQIRLRFGDPRAVVQPGPSWRWPLIEEMRTYDRRLLYLNTDEDVIQTKDQERIMVDNYAMWRIDDPKAFLSSFPKGVLQAERQLDRVVRARVREVVARHTLTQVLTDLRTQIMAEIRSGVTESFAGTGIAIQDVRINRTELPPGIELNVYARMKTDRERLARKHRAEGEEKARRIRAEADRDARIVVAKAQGEAEVSRGEGDAEATRIYAAAHGKDPEFFAFVRSLEAYRKTIGEGTTLIVSPDSEFFQFLVNSGLGDSTKVSPPP